MHRRVLAVALTGLIAPAAWATNGMNMESFGARAAGLGGASMAYDSGNSAVMNNPATLALRPDSTELGLGVTRLGPDVAAHTNMMGMDLKAQSGGTAYWMPSFSLIRKQGEFAYGVAVLAQGGMGTEYDANTFLAPSGLPQRSEVGFARAMFPLAWKVNERLALAAEVDFIWAGLDMQMDMTAGQMASGMMAGALSASGSMAPMLGTMPANGYARFDVSDKSNWKQQTRGHGWAYKLGVHYKINDAWQIGAAFHSKTRVKDFTGSGLIAMGVMGSAPTMVLPGRYTIRNFEWPTTFAVGAAWQPHEQWMIAADVKRLKWSETMNDFRVGFASAMGDLNVTMAQRWRDQTVYMIGVEYRPMPGVAWRVGYNYARNPIKEAYLYPLFPATVQKHFSFGIGMRMSKQDTLAFAMTFAPEVTQTRPGDPSLGLPAVTMTHSQFTLRVNWGHRF